MHKTGIMGALTRAERQMLFEARRSDADALWGEPRAAARTATTRERTRAHRGPAAYAALVGIGLALAVGLALWTVSVPTARSVVEWLMPLAE